MKKQENMQLVATLDELDKLIEKALKKVHASSENDLCKYLPGTSGGYIHHFTMRKLKNNEPDQLSEMLRTFILEREMPEVLPPKSRAPRGSRKRREPISITRTDIEKVLELARQVGDNDLLARFSPKRSLPTLKKELIRSIRANRVEVELWNAYSESMILLNSMSQLEKERIEV